MRTTVTLDADVAQKLKQIMKQQDSSFKEVINQVLRRGLGEPLVATTYTPVRFASGVREGVDLTKALQVAAALDDMEFARKVETGK